MPSLLLLLPTLLLAPPEPGMPADFKLAVELHGVEKGAIATGVIVVRKGTAYQFLSTSRDEVQVVDPAGPTVTLINLRKRLQTQVTAAQLAAGGDRLRRSIETAARRREASDDRSERVAAAMSRDLIEPNFAARYDETAHRLHLSNPSVDVDAAGEPDADNGRLGLIEVCLSALARLNALRDPAGLPPFTVLETYHALIGTRHLRPTDVSVVYRLAGPPRKLRWTYRLVPELTDDEREAISRVDSLRASARFVRYNAFESAAP